MFLYSLYVFLPFGHGVAPMSRRPLTLRPLRKLEFNEGDIGLAGGIQAAMRRSQRAGNVHDDGLIEIG